MRRIFLHIMCSVDGYIEDASQEMDWHFADDEWEDYVEALLRSIDGMIFGRRAHQLLAQYWPTAGLQAGATPRQVETARLMQALPKYVLSRGDYRTDWANSQVLDGDFAGTLRELKRQEGKDLALFAGARAFRALDALGLVDEYRIVLNPILLGGGTPLFAPGSRPGPLRLAGLRQFRSGAAVLCWQPVAPA